MMINNSQQIRFRLNSTLMFLGAFTLLQLMPLNTRGLLGAEYHIGPGKMYATPGDFPWENLTGGDVVYIYWREAPYKSLFVISRYASAESPIVVKGIAGPEGQQPVLEGDKAITRPQLNYNSQERGILKIGTANTPQGEQAGYVLIEGLEFRRARDQFTFIGSKGVQKFSKNAAGIYLENGDQITIRDCTFNNCANGLFVASDSKNILIEKCKFTENGVEGSYYEHNLYCAAGGITIQHNYLGPLRKNCPGNNLKDRSAGLVVRYNWIEGGNRQIDLVDAEDTAVLRNDPRYSNTLVYGNVFIERTGDGNNQIIHYGGDSGEESWYRKGTLYFYHNTVVSERADNTCLFRLTTSAESAIAMNNLIYSKTGGKKLSLLEENGKLEFTNNWVSKGYLPSFEGEFHGVISEGDIISGESPLFTDGNNYDLKLKTGSPCIGKAAKLPGELSKHHPIFSLNKQREITPRSKQPLSLGAME